MTKALVLGGGGVTGIGWQVGVLTRARITAEIASVGADRTLLIEPDEAALAAMGENMMDNSRRAASVRAGIRQAPALTEAVRSVWSG